MACIFGVSYECGCAFVASTCEMINIFCIIPSTVRACIFNAVQFSIYTQNSTDMKQTFAADFNSYNVVLKYYFFVLVLLELNRGECKLGCGYCK